MGHVNRRLGSISEFESWWSIGHKFAYLNRVSFAEFVRIAHGNEKIRSTKVYSVKKSIIGIDKKRAADLFEAPVSTFLYSDDAIYIPTKLGEIPSTDCMISQLRYCPECLKRGFHSPAHQLSWLEKCLIHGCHLVVGCPACGNNISYDLIYDCNYGNSRVERYHCPCGEPLWKELLSWVWPKPMDSKTLQPIRSYLEWIQHLDFPGYKSLSAAYRFTSNSYRFVNLEDNRWLMCCLSSISNVPLEVKPALYQTVAPYSQRLASPDVMPAIIIEVIQQYGYRWLLQAYRLWHEQTYRRPMFLSLAKSLRRHLNKGHTRCFTSCYRLYKTKKYYFSNSDNAFIYCNHAYNVANFVSNWMILDDDKASDNKREGALKLALKLSELGVVSYKKNKRRKRKSAWSLNNPIGFFNDYPIEINVCAGLSGLMERLWVLEMLRHATALQILDCPFEYISSVTFDRTYSAPLVLLEPGPNNTLDIWIWPRKELHVSIPHMGARALRRHIAQVGNEVSVEEKRIIDEGHPLERYNNLRISDGRFGG